ncbi:hypothetical protein BS78_06G238600 [Paspalum vaginatum]|nr:hypothetical protein BS78_06G238600 [Paspalum vaginatum]
MTTTSIRLEDNNGWTKVGPKKIKKILENERLNLEYQGPSSGFLKILGGNVPFEWFSLPARGSAGGILVGANLDLYNICLGDVLSYTLSVFLTEKKTGFNWKLVVVYGSPYEGGKQEFLEELDLVVSKWNGPMLIGGDFNLVRFSHEKNNGGLIELEATNGCFTWTNNQDNLVKAKLDRILVSPSWDAVFPLARVRLFDHLPSDHNPLLLDVGINMFFGKKKFRFEKWWLDQEDFCEVAKKAWTVPCEAVKSIDRWQFRVRVFRRMARGWAANRVSFLNKEKKELAKIYNTLDKISDERMLSIGESKKLKEVGAELDKFWALEEIKARQRARERDILEGDRNTTYFQAVANRRSRKKRVESLVGPEGIVSDQKGMIDIAVNFYKDLFAAESRGHCRLSEDFWSVNEIVSDIENASLIAPFSEEEIKTTLFSCYSEGPLGPDGLPFLFFQKFWEIIKEDLVALFEDFFRKKMDIYRLNFALITLVPKVADATHMKQFRPISLINCSFKLVSKLLTLRTSNVLQRLIAPNQSAFLKCRYILESVVVAHEIVHNVHRKGEQGLVLKLDYEKAYDRVSWDFLFEVLSSRGFSDTWISWIKSLVMGGSVGVVLNGEDSPFFKTNYDHLANLKCILIWFENLSGMKINFHKSEIVALNSEEHLVHEISHLLGCPLGSFAINYLGVPLHFDKLSREDLQPLVDKMLKRVAGWRGKLLSYGARLVLIKSCLASIPVYLLSFIKFPKWALKLLNTHMANCLWNDVEGNRKYHLANWESVAMCKDFGGTGVPNLRDLNICLLISWIKRYINGEGKLWREILDFKYNTKNPNIFSSKDNGAFQFFKSFILAIQFWELYILINEKSGTTAELWDGENLKCTFRRTFTSELYNVWMEVVQLARTIVLSEEDDTLIWQFSSSGIYSSQSLYKVINFRGVHQVHVSGLWSVKIPPRVHFFLSLLANNKVLTRSNLAKRRNVEDQSCLFCIELETCQHLFFECVVAKKMWRVLSDILGLKVGCDFHSVGRLWLSDRKFLVHNVLCVAALWGLWKLRNEFCFQSITWRSLEHLLLQIWKLGRNWVLLCSSVKKQELEGYLEALKKKSEANVILL